MIAKTLKYLFSYSERALTPKSYSSLLQSSSKNVPLSEIMHNLYLYEHNINVFDIDYFQRIAYSLLDFQKKMSVSEIITVLRLGMKHNVRNQMIWRHFEAEIHRRLHNCMAPIFEAEQKQYEASSKNMFKQLEAQSQDYYDILTPQFTASQVRLENSVQKLDSIALKQQKQATSIKDLTAKKSPQQITKFAYDLVQILVWYGCENIRLINLLLQTQLHPLVLKKSPNTAIRNAELLVYALQVNMKEYQSNKAKYTARSIKKIYKFQGSYFPELIEIMKASLGQFSAEEIRHITEVIRSFPVKKREHRRVAVQLLSNEWKNREKGLLEQEKQKLEQILGKDEKLIAKFRKTLEISEEKAPVVEAHKNKSTNQKE